MDRKTRQRIREFAQIVDATMSSIPLSVPPRPTQLLAMWDGAVIDVSELHRAYNRLPRAIQDIAAPGYRRCLDVLNQQNGTAVAALTVRYQLFADFMAGTGLTPEELVPDLRDDPHLSLVPDDEPAGSADESDNDVGFVAPFVGPMPDDPENALHGARRLALRRGLWTGLGASVESRFGITVLTSDDA